MGNTRFRGQALAATLPADGGEFTESTADAGELPARGFLQRLRRSRDEARLRRAQCGNAAAFAEIWRQHARLVHAILISMVREEDAEDLMQEVALAAWKHLASVRSCDGLGAWVSSIARNIGRDALRSRSGGATQSLPEEGIAVESRAGDGDLARLVIDRIRGLPEAYREVLMLRLVLELSATEIAQQTGLTPGSVRVNLCRGMKKLREQLEGVTWVR